MATPRLTAELATELKTSPRTAPRSSGVNLTSPRKGGLPLEVWDELKGRGDGSNLLTEEDAHILDEAKAMGDGEDEAAAREKWNDYHDFLWRGEEPFWAQ